MFTKSILVVSGALLTAVAAVPMAEPHHHHRHHPQHKRDYVWVTETEEVIQTVPVTKTVWVEPGETIPTAYSSAEKVKPAAYTPAASPSSPAAYVAPVYSSPAESSRQPSPVAPTSSHVAPVPTSTYVAPVPTSTYVAPPVYSAPPPSVYVAPTPTSTFVAPYVAPTPSSSAAPIATSATPPPSDSPPADSGSGGSGVTGMAAPGKSYTGDVTYYAVGMGSCGFTSTEDEKVVAVSHEIMSAYNGANPNANPLCGTYITITGKDGNKYPAKIVDTCPGCDKGSLDLPQAYFNKITGNGDGRVGGIEWCFG
ncbi:uncharacterized protein RCC_10436 [Ramularia collo-cygni]|uniref:Rasp f 7 allergen n=1 Tax=Ramularia collo-cygni TaxID=112498 RepID=A0A2D3VR23_9PEZI|nr:uncharacterized protein RCC_10436 [Ramularia collo-cygni]CZT24708.1 uncharacterized protein RCC_10436 [Ramularia collo-cygni]